MNVTNAMVFQLTIDPAATNTLPEEQAEQLLYISGEAVSNALRHSRAKNVRVSLSEAHDYTARLRVVDDGQGFDVEKGFQQLRGLTSMRNRARKIGALFSIESEPNICTRVIVTVPSKTVVTAETVGPNAATIRLLSAASKRSLKVGSRGACQAVPCRMCGTMYPGRRQKNEVKVHA